MVNIWEIVVSVFGAFGGIESIKYLLERRVNMRRARTQAYSDEFHVLRETTEFLQQQLKTKEEQAEAQNLRIRDLQQSLFGESERRHKAEMDLAIYRCESQDCPHRIPPRESNLIVNPSSS